MKVEVAVLGSQVPNKPTVSVDVKQDSTRRQYYQHTHTHTQIKSDTLVKLYRVAAMSQSQIFTAGEGFMCKLLSIMIFTAGGDGTVRHPYISR